MSINVQFANLEPHVQDKFIAIARKDPEGRTAAEWFEHLVPEPLQDSSAETEVFMDGGTVTQEVWVYDQGRGGGHYETVEHQIGDRDVSRIESGHNGGEYTHDNTIMEDSSVNRSRGADNMTGDEYDAAVEANAADTSLIDGGQIISDTTSVTDGAASIAQETTVFDVAGDVLSDALAPAVGAYLAGKVVADKMKTPQDKIGWGALASGGGALLCMTPVGQGALALYGGYRLTTLVIKGVSSLAAAK